ncbi:MAG TPA: MFS transporter [Solirubrobacteraceae bacterium]|jgi:MFS family permease|nr:MFS transporter [Solirubrobacteraceae bacterium]
MHFVNSARRLSHGDPADPLPSAFRRLWGASAVANLGDGLFKTALPLLAVATTKSPAVVASVTLALTLPWALVALPAGAILDRADRRRVMVLANGARVLTLGALAGALLIGAGEIPALLVCAFVLGICEVFADMSAGTLVPTVVQHSQLDRANSRLLGAETVLNEFVGPPLAGALIAVGTTAALATSSITYLLAAFVLAMLPGTFRPAGRPAEPGESTTSQMLGDIADGLRWVWRHPTIRALCLMAAVMAASWSAWLALLPAYAVAPGPMGLTPFGYGVLLTAVAAGGLAGTLVAPAVQRRLGLKTVVGVDIAATATMIAAPAVTTDARLVAAGVLIGGLGSGMWNVVVATLRQTLTPDELLGRVASTGRMLSWGMLPVGAGLAALVAHLASMRLVFVLATLATLALLPYLRRVKLDPDAATGIGEHPVHAPRPAANATQPSNRAAPV